MTKKEAESKAETSRLRQEENNRKKIETAEKAKEIKRQHLEAKQKTFVGVYKKRNNKRSELVRSKKPNKRKELNARSNSKRGKR